MGPDALIVGAIRGRINPLCHGRAFADM